MVIDVKQKVAENKNEFDILYDNKKVYHAVLPFLKIKGMFNLEKLIEIKVFDLRNEMKFKSSYNYFDNKIEELIPFKYLVSKSQKFNQFKFIDKTNDEEASIFLSVKELWYESYIIKYQDNFYNCYSIDDGYIRHICIYEENIQVAELLKPNVIIDGKDTYRIYLKDEYSFLSNACFMLALYLDRLEYNSNNMINKSQVISKNYSYSKINKYYDPNWVKDNFEADEYFNKISNEVLNVKKEINVRVKKLLTMMGILWGVLLLITIILLIIFL